MYGCIPIVDPIDASIGRSIETVARLDVISVRKLTDKTSNNKIINGEKFFKKIDWLPIHSAKPLFCIANAIERPAPKSNTIPHGSLIASSHSINFLLFFY